MCNVEQIADCGDISSLGRSLFINEKEDNIWLSQCVVSLSPCGNLLAVGYKKRLCLLTTQWISSNDSSTYLISWSGTLALDITSILTLSICPTKHSSQNGPDWFCIVVGFQNGSVGFYTNTGHLLLQEKLDDKPVSKISCHTGTYGTLLDDIHIFFSDCVCVVAGANLFQTLRVAKAQLAKVQAGVQEEYAIDNRNIHIRKWTLTDQDEINDIAIAGLELVNTYDHYLGASTYGGYDAWYRSIPPVKTLVLAAGVGPYMGFHYALEGGTTPPLQDVARAVANKIKSALPGWLGGSTEVGPTTTEPLIRAEQLAMRSSIYDAQRHGTAVTISPDRRLAAFADNLGRVAVLDIAKGFIIRLFKGCRDAQCAFVQVFDADNKKPQTSVAKEIRRAVFLIIYMPKKGLVDIRLMQRGTRVAVFTATKNGKLLYNSCGLVGAEKNYTHKKLNLPEIQCVLFDPDGKLKKFNIPFYFALEGEHLERSRDLHVIREIRDIIKKTSGSLDECQAEIVENVAKLKTLEIRKHCLEILIKNCASVNTIISCIKVFWDELIDEELVPYNEKVKNYFGNLIIITYFYCLINEENTEAMQDLIEKVYDIFEIKQDSGSADTENVNEKDISFQLLEDDTCILERLLILAHESNSKDQDHAKVTFADSQSNNYKEFINSFALEEQNRYIYMKNDLSIEKLNSISRNVFISVLKLKDFSVLTNHLKSGHVDPQEILKIVIMHLVNIPLKEMTIELIEKFIAIVYYICKASEEASCAVYNEISPWWDNIRKLLVDLRCPLRSMIVAMACKAAGKIFETFEASSESDCAWESVTSENAKWGILIGKLEDISILSIVLLNRATFKGVALPKLQLSEIIINLKYVYTRGKGSVTELIAKWLCSMGIPPIAIVVNELMELFDPDSSEEDDRYEYVFVLNNRFHVESNPQIFKWLSLLRRQFPLSTKADYILANMCWEYAIEWQKCMSKTELLAAVTECLYNISDMHLRLGLFSIIWSTYLKQIFEACCKLVNKVGKLPKDALCLQDLTFNSECLVTTLKIINNYLDKFSVCLKSSAECKKQSIQYEKIWDESLPSLVEVAQDTKNVNKDILNLNFQVSCTIYYQCHFIVKFPKPLDTLFDVDYEYILEAFTDTPTIKEINMNCSEKIKSPRMKFITKLIRKAIDTISSERSLVEYDDWIGRIYNLALLWTLDEKFVYHQNIIGLYHMGHDQMVLDRLSSDLDSAYLIEPLVAISVQRMKRSHAASSNQLEWIATISATLYHRLRHTELDTSVPPNPSMATTALILRRLLNEISKHSDSACDSHDVRLAAHLAENCEFIARRKL